LNRGRQRLGLFVTFEGPEGCGKTTQMRLLAAHLREQGVDVLTTREPGSTPIGERVRAILLDPKHTEMQAATEFLLFSAARAQHVEQVIRPHLAQEGVVLCDRYADSSLAYQGYGHRLDLETLRAITRFATRGLMPDLTLYLDIPIQLGLKRKAGGDGDAWNRMEQKEIAFHERMRSGYRTMAAKEPQRWVTIGATGDVDEIQEIIRAAIQSELQKRREP